MPQPEHQLLAIDWYYRALEDWEEALLLAAKRSDSPNALWLVQQAVEKSLKSLLLSRDIGFRKIHDLEQLRSLLPSGYQLKTDPSDLNVLTQRGMESRYPGEYDDISPSDVTEAIELGRRVIQLLKEEFDTNVLNGIDPATLQPY